LCHSEEHIEQMKKTAAMKPRDLHRLASDYNSVFLNQQSYSAALLAAGAACNATRSILTGQVLHTAALHNIPLPYTLLHCTALHTAALHYTLLHCTTHCCTALHTAAPHYTLMHCTTH